MLHDYGDIGFWFITTDMPGSGRYQMFNDHFLNGAKLQKWSCLFLMLHFESATLWQLETVFSDG